MLQAAGSPESYQRLQQELHDLKQLLKAREADYQSLLETIPQIVWRADSSGAATHFNSQWSVATGLTLAESLGFGFHCAVHPEDRDRLQNSWRQAVAIQQPYDEDCRLRLADGSYHQFVVRAQPVLDEQHRGAGWVGTYTDVNRLSGDEGQPGANGGSLAMLPTPQQEAETIYSIYRTTQNSVFVVEWLTLALEAACMGSWDWDLTTNKITWTSYHETIFGYESGNPNRTYDDWATRVHSEDLPTVEALIQIAITNHRDYGCEYRVCWPDGTTRWVSDFGRVFYNDEGRPVRMLGVVLDITDRKQADLSFQKWVEELDWKNRLLTQTTTLLRKRNEELDRFAYVASHDLKAPLRAIANLSEWIEEDLAGQLPSENQYQMQLLRQRVRRMEGLIDGLLTYSRAGRGVTSLETVAVDSLLIEIVDSLVVPPDFCIEIASEMPTLETKRIPLTQVFSNLINNAIQHHTRRDGNVVISVQDQGDRYEFAVIDDGPGIAPSDHERVFEIFQTLKPPEQGTMDNSSPSKESSGLGLAIVKKIVEAEGGSIHLESEVGQGATFRFSWLKQPKELAKES